MAACDECKTLVEKTLHVLLDEGGEVTCAGLSAGVGSACVIAAGGPEDPVGDVVCAVAAAMLDVYCNEKGIPWMKSHESEAAADICKEIGICT